MNETPSAKPALLESELSVIHQMASQLAERVSMEEIVDVAAQGILDFLNPDLVVIYCRDGDRLSPLGKRPFNPDFRGASPDSRCMDRCLCGLTARDGKAVHSTDIRSDPRCTLDDCKEAGFRSFSAIPLMVSGELEGVLGMASRSPRDFSRHEAVLKSIGSHIAIALKNALLHHRLTEQADQLTQSHNLLQSILHAVPDLLVVVDRDFNILFSNDKGHDLVKASPHTDSRTCYGRFKLLHAPCEDCSALPVFESGEIVEREMVNPADGRPREVRAFPIHDEKGRVSMVVEYVRDISEHVLTQQENIQRKQFLESVLYHAPDAIVTLDSDHRVIDWNPGAVKMFGFTPEEAVGINLDDLVARGDAHGEASRNTRHVLSGQRMEALETIRYRKDGTPLHVIAAGSPIVVEGRLQGVVAVYTNITDRVQAEAALRESESKYRALVEKCPLGISVVGKDGRYKYINPEFTNMFGYSLADVPTGKEWFKKAFPDKSHRGTVIKSWLEETRRGETEQNAQWTFQVACKDGSLKQVLFRTVELENRDRFVIYEDITDKRKLEQQLQQAQKFEAIGTLAGGVAHDFNNLLMGIQGRASLVGMDLNASHPHREHISAIEEYVRSATDLTKQLLGFARGGKYEVKPTDLNELLVNNANMFGRTRKQIQIQIKTQEAPLVVEADRRQIEQVLLNMFVNAWQAMPDGGALYLETRTVALDEDGSRPHQVDPGVYAMISVTDTGIGMSDATRQRIFDPFFSTKAKGRGTGLGLASAYGIIKNHHGMITVYSEPGQGATFNVYLPLSDREVKPEAPMEGSPVRGWETVLLVDDEDMILKVGSAMLRKLGYRVLTAEGGQKALEVLHNTRETIDLVILDLIMPGMDGRRTFDRLREMDSDMPVILSSGFSLNGQAENVMRKGCNAFIQKPFNISELSATLRKVLDGRRTSGSERPTAK